MQTAIALTKDLYVPWRQLTKIKGKYILRIFHDYKGDVTLLYIKQAVERQHKPIPAFNNYN